MHSILFPQLIAEFGGERQIVVGDSGRQFPSQPTLIGKPRHRPAEQRGSLPGMLRMTMKAFDHRAKLVSKHIVVAGAAEPTHSTEFEEADAAIRAMNGRVEQRRHAGQPFLSNRSISSRICAARS
jgi:hypothetical protein